MPYYEYQCNECDHQFEVYRRATDPPLSRCPQCRGRVRKIFRPVGIIFKGPGFHVTDYPSSRDKASRKPDEPVSAGGAKDTTRPAKEAAE